MTPIPNPVAPAAATVDRDGQHKILLCVGGLRPEKDHRTLIAAFARIAAARPDWSLRIVGDGECRAELQAQVQALGLGSRVEFTGAVADVAPQYAVADLFVVPSSYESFGLATAEALAAGLPALGFADCPGTNELIRDGINGVLVAGSDRVGGLAEGLSRLMGSAELRRKMAQAAPPSVAQFALDAVVGEWEGLLARVAKG
jgi:glycosyltransferase involved in cell wall biosynthesis